MGDKKTAGAEVREDIKKKMVVSSILQKKRETRSVGGNRELRK